MKCSEESDLNTDLVLLTNLVAGMRFFSLCVLFLKHTPDHRRDTVNLVAFAAARRRGASPAGAAWLKPSP
jgi:hypothetical protein